MLLSRSISRNILKPSFEMRSCSLKHTNTLLYAQTSSARHIRAFKSSNLSVQHFWRSKQGAKPVRASESSKQGYTAILKV